MSVGYYIVNDTYNRIVIIDAYAGYEKAEHIKSALKDAVDSVSEMLLNCTTLSFGALINYAFAAANCALNSAISASFWARAESFSARTAFFSARAESMACCFSFS